MYTVVLLLATITVFIYDVVAGPCENGWRYFPVTNACYKLIEDELPWTAAEFKCLFQGAHHTSIENAAENQFVNEISHHGVTWIGAAVFGKSKSYMYSDQSPYGHYANWRGGMIPRINPARRCIKMDRNGYWFQSCCKLRSISVCKKPATLWESTNDLTEFRRSKFRKF